MDDEDTDSDKILNFKLHMSMGVYQAGTCPQNNAVSRSHRYDAVLKGKAYQIIN